MKSSLIELPGLEVVVENVVYMPSLDAPEERPHPFAYWIRIENDSTEAVTIKGRKWVVREENGEISVVEGDGVVGKFPHLDIGEHFSYNSYLTARDHGVASGAFYGETDTGVGVYARIPKFKVSLPPQ